MGNRRTILSLAEVMDVDTFEKLQEALNVVQPNGWLAQRSSFQDSQSKSSPCWDSPPAQSAQKGGAPGQAEGCPV